MIKPFIIYLRNKTSFEFELKRDVSSVSQTDRGYTITFNSGKSYNYGKDKVLYYPLVSSREDVLIYENGILNNRYNSVDSYGRYFIFRNKDFVSEPIRNSSDIEVVDTKKNIKKNIKVIDYFKEILTKSGEVSFEIQTEEISEKQINQVSSEILLKALERINIKDPRIALSKYLDASNPSLQFPSDTIIYPFGCNESQKMAVETSLHNGISIIEGPPGTGKTQTILNIIANLIVANKTVAIVSNNNSAVFNVRDKLQKCGYGMLVASLGNNENKQLFFENLDQQVVDENFKLSDEEITIAQTVIHDLDTILIDCFKNRNKLAVLKTQLLDAEIEYNHIKKDQPLSSTALAIFDKKYFRNWTYVKLMKLKDLLSKYSVNNKISLLGKLRLILQYGLFNLQTIANYYDEFYSYINHRFYELYIEHIKSEIKEIETWLKLNNEKVHLKEYIETSKELFNASLYKRYHNIGEADFTKDNYRNQFVEFVKHYPITLSSTLSLQTTIPKEFLFDYLIIDEASQVDLIKSAVCFSCCRNVIIVGDSMQLTHIVDAQSKDVVDQIHQQYQIEPAYDYVKQNILNSLKCLYGNSLKSVLLKEHYRCHPLIIGFCNKKYYNNSLVVMTKGDNDPFKIIETSIAGGKSTYNQRQIDETNLYIRENYTENYRRVGVIAPYRNHANMLQKQLPEGTESDTIHKYQGREKSVIIFNTVKNQIEEFIDNPNLINVAVSRAEDEFIIVKPESMELPHGTNIGDLIRYMCYTTDADKTIVHGKVYSVFDLLYKEYNKICTSFLSSNHNINGSVAEVIIHKLLAEKVLKSNSQYSSIDFVREYKLRDLVKDYLPFTEEEVSFIKNNSRLDFLLYNKIDKTPILAIEVDGVSFHDNELQQARDLKKNHILEVIGLPLLRLSTDGCNEVQQIIESLNIAMR